MTTKEKIEALGQEKVSEMTMAELKNELGISYSPTDALKALGWKVKPAEGRTATEKPVKVKTVKADKRGGCIPARIEQWIIRRLPESEEGYTVTPEIVEPFIVADSPAWNLLVVKGNNSNPKNDEEVAAFEQWLGTPCTVYRREMIGANERKSAAKAERLAMLTAENEKAAMFIRFAESAGFRCFIDDFGFLTITQNWPRSWAN